MSLTPICIGLIAIGLGVGLAWPHLLTRVFQVASAGEQDLAAASVQPYGCSPPHLAPLWPEWSRTLPDK